MSTRRSWRESPSAESTRGVAGEPDRSADTIMITTGPIEAFFKAPTEAPSNEGDCLLYHLRADLESLYGAESTESSVFPSHVLLATTGMLNGIDYLSQVYSTKTTQHERFTGSLRDLLGQSADEAEALYQLRCAVVHEVGLSVRSGARRNGKRFTFELTTESNGPMIREVSDSASEVRYSVGVWGLKRSFLALVRCLHQLSENPGDPRNNHVIGQIGRMHSEKLVRR